MDSEAILSQVAPLLRKYWPAIGLGLVGLIFFVYGLISLFGSASKESEISFTRENLTSKTENFVYVDVEGAVVRAGVYKLNQDSIIQDALVAAGGLSADADREFVSKNINLASKLTDGAKIYVPKVGESSAQAKGVPDVAGGIGGGGGSIYDLININTATGQTLDTLPGIGQVTANKIINNRPYLSINELLDKKVVSSKVFTQIKDRITAY